MDPSAIIPLSYRNQKRLHVHIGSVSVVLPPLPPPPLPLLPLPSPSPSSTLLPPSPPPSCLHPAMTLRTEFLSRSDPGLGETWTARLVGESRVTRPLLVSLILYVYNEGDGEMAFHTTTKESVEEIYGYTPEVQQQVEAA